jgi:hypothetical protein
MRTEKEVRDALKAEISKRKENTSFWKSLKEPDELRFCNEYIEKEEHLRGCIDALKWVLNEET